MIYLKLLFRCVSFCIGGNLRRKSLKGKPACVGCVDNAEHLFVRAAGKNSVMHKESTVLRQIAGRAHSTRASLAVCTFACQVSACLMSCLLPPTKMHLMTAIGVQLQVRCRRVSYRKTTLFAIHSRMVALTHSGAALGVAHDPLEGPLPHPAPIRCVPLLDP